MTDISTERHGDGPIVVGIMYPAEWDFRPRAEIDSGFDRLRAISPRIEIVDVRYSESLDLRTRRGADPAADLRQLAPALTAEQRDAFARVEVVLTMDLPFDVGYIAPKLRWVQGLGAGVGHFASSGVETAGVTVTSAAGVNAVAIAEFVMARLLQVWKRLPEIDAAQRERAWRPAYGTEIAGSTLGIVGLGSIGREVARRARAFGMRVVATRRNVSGEPDPDVDEVLPPDRLVDLLAQSDAVVAAVPETAETTDLFDAAAFAAMRRGALFCNVGRGSAVDEVALVAALADGQLRTAIVDVVREEPLPDSSPLWSVPGLLISPHCATSPDRLWTNLYDLFADNLRRYVAGVPLRNVVG